ncbi:hypothetical protein C0995_006191 [Termitomyces sp. Mi166|nr:hypothetical protein C0995_006191 [Termitomyces sp. Mi166\
MASFANDISLPIELQHAIIDYLRSDSRSLAQCSAVCTSWRLHSYRYKFARVTLAWGSVLFFQGLLKNEFSASAVVRFVRSIHILGPPNALPTWDVQKVEAIQEILGALSAPRNIREFSLQNLAWILPAPEVPSLNLSGLSTVSTLELLQITFHTRAELVAFLENFQRLRHLVLEDVGCVLQSPSPTISNVVLPPGSYGLTLRCPQDFSLKKRLRWDCVTNDSNVSAEDLADLTMFMSERNHEFQKLQTIHFVVFDATGDPELLKLFHSPNEHSSSSLKFNAVSDWWDEYISYDSLKRHIYQLEKEQHGEGRPYRDIEANEQDSLLGQSGTNVVFEPLLNKELKKIDLFYQVQENELIEEVAELEELVEKQEEAGLDDRYFDDPDDDDDDDDESISRSPERRRRQISSTRRNISREPSSSAHHHHRLSISSVETVDNEGLGGSVSKLANKIGDTLRDNIMSNAPEVQTIWNSRTDYAYDIRLLFKRKITTSYVAVANLRSYVEVNYSGFRKILKKYDKVTYSEVGVTSSLPAHFNADFAQLKERYMHQAVETSYPFMRETKDRLEDARRRLVSLYTKCVTNGDRRLASQQLKLHQRENIAWERDTVWRQMIAQQRRGEVEGEPLTMGALLKPPGPGLFYIPTPLGTIRVTRKMIYKTIAGIIFVTLLNVQVLETLEANRCFAILMFCTFLWATEVIRSDAGNVLSRPAATQIARWVFSIMFSPTIMLLIGGFTISSALSKTNIDRVLITKVLSLAGTRPSTVLLAFMGVSCFASMWISNVAAPTLCFTLIRPILRTLPPKSAFGPCLILAIALAANIGGQSSPISSPQNLIALHDMDNPIDWATWFAVALPVSAISIFLIWGMLLMSYRPARAPDGDGEIEIKQIRPTRDPFTHKQWWVTIVCLVTIGLWCVAHQIEPYVGDMGVIAILPIVAFFSTGVLKKDDFEQFMWTIVFLAMGGIALGKGVMSSGLLDIVDGIVHDLVQDVPLYPVVLILSPVILVRLG